MPAPGMTIETVWTVWESFAWDCPVVDEMCWGACEIEAGDNGGKRGLCWGPDEAE